VKVGDLVKLSDFGKMRTAHIWEHKIKIPKCGIITKVESTSKKERLNPYVAWTKICHGDKFLFHVLWSYTDPDSTLQMMVLESHLEVISESR
jgi:hypothetical protein